MRKDEYAALKRFPITRFLAAVNVVPAYVTGREHYYRSPLREERTESFTVNSLKNCWMDHGLGVGGNLLDLAMRLWNTTYKTAGQMLAQVVANADQLPAPDAAAAERNELFVVEAPGQQMQVTRLASLRHPHLREYLVSRGISLAAIEADARVWSLLCEVHYTQRRKNGTLGRYYSIGMRNESGGLELTNKGFKSCIGPKDVTFIPGRQPGVAIFEGMLDFLSALTRRYKKHGGKVSGFQCSVLILHSARLAKKSLHLVEGRGSIFYYGDNDQTGIDLLHWYKRVTRKTCAFYAMNEQYRGYKDYNDWLCKKKPEKPLPGRGQAPSRQAETAKWWLWVVFEEKVWSPVTKLWAWVRGKPGVSSRHRARECTFYAYDNTPASLERLLVLRNRLSEDAKVIRLCTRTSGRHYTYEQLYCPTGQLTTHDSPQVGQRATLGHGNPGSWGRPGNAPEYAQAA